MRRPILAASALAAATLVFAAEPQPSGVVWNRIKVPGHGSLAFPAPKHWSANASPWRDGPIVVQLGPGPWASTTYEVQLRIQPPPRRPEISDLQALRISVEGVRDVMAASASTPEIPVVELQGASLTGYYFSVTDRNAAPTGGWRFMTYGSALVEDLVVTFTVHSNQSSEHQVAPMLELMKQMKWEPPTHEEAAAAKAKAAVEAARWATIDLEDIRGLQFTLALPDKGWALWMDLPGYRSERQEVAPDQSRATMTMSDPGTHVTVSASIDRQKNRNTVGACRSRFYASGASRVNEREEERDGVLLVHYNVPYFDGFPIDQQHTDAYLYRDGTCIDVHISKSGYRPADKRYFDAVLSAMKFVKKK